MENPESSFVTTQVCSTSEMDQTTEENTRPSSSNEDLEKLKHQVLANLKKPNVPNVNIPEKIILCIDVCHDSQNSLYKLSDGSTFTPINMLKRVLDFFIYSKNAINKQTEFALMILKDSEAVWIQDFTYNLKDIVSAIDHLTPEICTSDSFQFKEVFNVLEDKLPILDEDPGSGIAFAPHVYRMILIYGRSNCLPAIPSNHEFLTMLKRSLYFYIDIILAHEEDCSSNKCEEIYSTLEDLDNGYSYVFEVSRNATKIHDNMAKLLAHPFQRPLQKDAKYSFGSLHR